MAGISEELEGILPVNQAPILPVFAHDNLPSAAQPFVLIGIVESDDSYSVAYSDGVNWNRLAEV